MLFNLKYLPLNFDFYGLSFVGWSNLWSNYLPR
nr:MAG TPA: hypothetical protein [Crassvirales sp.]